MTEQFYVRVEDPAKTTDDRSVPSWGEFMQEINDLAARGYRDRDHHRTRGNDGRGDHGEG